MDFHYLLRPILFFFGISTLSVFIVYIEENTLNGSDTVLEVDFKFNLTLKTDW